MSTAEILGWFFGLVYPVVSIAVWSVGAFGIGATRSDLRQAALEKARDRYPSSFYGRDFADGMAHYFNGDFYWAIWFTALGGLFWPIAVPVYLGYRKGSFIDKAVEKRDANIIELSKRVAS